MWVLPYLFIALGIVLLDQVSKLLVLRFLYEGQFALIPNVLHFTYVENDGMAFGLLSDHRWIFMVLSVIGIGAMCFYLYAFAKTRCSRIALSLIIAGGIGNMIDRVRLGFVVDFIDFCAFPQLWSWVFNIADAAVCIGAALFAFDLIREAVGELRAARQKTNEDGSDGTNA